LENPAFDGAKDRIKACRKMVFFTGAGISQESGLATFRGRDGYWKKYDPMKMATPEAFFENPKLVWEWYYERRRKVLEARPNAGHLAIAGIQNYKEVQVVTQNVDDLHHVAGSRNIIELHGNIFKVKCTVCSYHVRMDDRFPPPPPSCKKCGHLLRPDVVWFGEPLPQASLEQAIKHSSDCDVMVIVGSSLQVAPANSLPTYAKENGAYLIEINVEPTALTGMMDLSIRSTASESLPLLLKVPTD
jgi:NAD-dependent deacetylase